MTRTTFKRFQRFLLPLKKNIELVYSTLEALQAQTSKLDEAITFLSLKYDGCLKHLDSSECTNSVLRKQVIDLKWKIEVLERHLRIATIEILSIPLSDKENNDALIANIPKIGTALDQLIQQDDTRNIYRTNSQAASPSSGTVVVEFKLKLKENVLKFSRVYNKTHKGTKFSTA